MIQALEWQRQGVGVLGHSKTLKGGTRGGRKREGERGRENAEEKRKKNGKELFGLERWFMVKSA